MSCKNEQNGYFVKYSYNFKILYLQIMVFVKFPKKAPLIRDVLLHYILIPPCVKLRIMTRHLFSASFFVFFDTFVSVISQTLYHLKI